MSQENSKIKVRLKELDKLSFTRRLTPLEKREHGKLTKSLLNVRYATPPKYDNF